MFNISTKKEIILSIIIPVYNVEKYVECCLKSVISQNSTKIEVVVVNDGSTDKSLKICEEYSDKFTYIKIVTQTNKGLSEARNTGIRHSNGEYLLFLDSDDYLLDNCLYKIINDLQYRHADISLGRAYSFVDGDSKLSLCQVDYKKYNTQIPSSCFSDLNKSDGFWFAAWLVIIKRSFILNNRLFFKKGIYHEDELWVPSVFAKASTLSLLNYGFYCYRVGRVGSIVYSNNIKREFDKILVADELFSLQNVSTESKKMLNERCASLLLGIILSLNCFRKDLRYFELLKVIRKRLKYLKCKKYILVLFICYIIGIKNTAYLLNTLFKKKIENSGI